MWHLVSYAAEPLPTMATIVPTMLTNSSALAGSMGIPVLIIAIAGMAFTLKGKFGETTRTQGVWISAAALIAGCWLFHSIVTPTPDWRYMLSGVPPLILFLTAGIYGISRMLRRPPVQMAMVVLIVYATGTFRLMRTPHIGYAAVASSICGLARSPSRKRRLIS